LKRTIISFFITILVLSGVLFSCSPARKNIAIAFYNVENLFDTINDQGTNDGEFSPSASIPWNTERYNKKLNNISEVVSSMYENNPPEILGLCEVENRTVLNELLATKKLNRVKYEIIHYDSHDERGIDNALLYKKNVFKPLFNSLIPVRFPFDPSDRTRDILFVKGIIGKDTLCIFVNHWHSRSGGQQKSEPKRIETAKILKHSVDSLFNRDHFCRIIIMGDFNDNPDNVSIKDVLGAQPVIKPINERQLYNLSDRRYLEKEGTCFWKSWDMFDQMIVSSALLDNEGHIGVEPADMSIFKPDWLLFFPEKGPARPNRTKGRNYYGGYSDHLPVYITLKMY